MSPPDIFEEGVLLSPPAITRMFWVSFALQSAWRCPASSFFFPVLMNTPIPLPARLSDSGDIEFYQQALARQLPPSLCQRIAPVVHFSFFRDRLDR